MSNTERKFGWRPDTPDNRDFYYRAPRALALKLPKSVDLRKKMPPVQDQGSLGSCTANAIGGAIGFVASLDKVAITPSRLFIYYNERVIEKTVSYDSGAEIRNGIKTVVKTGSCQEALWPYVIKTFTKKPAPPTYVDAKKHLVSRYERVDNSNLANIKAALAEGYPVVFGFTCYSGFDSDKAAKRGILDMPKPGEKSLGGHAVVIVGYNDKSKRVIVRNSYGVGWGNCFTGDTKVSLLNGKERSIKKLSESKDKFWVYAYDVANDKIVPALAWAKKSGSSSKLVKVTLDNGEEIRCTEDHLWMKRDGAYVKASQLKKGISLMPLYRKHFKGYEKVLSNEAYKWLSTAHIVSKELQFSPTSNRHAKNYCYGEDCKTVTHHVDHNPKNNDPDNIEVMYDCQHRQYHAFSLKSSIRKSKAGKKSWASTYEDRVGNSIEQIQNYNRQVASGDVELTETQIIARRKNGSLVGNLPKKPHTARQREQAAKQAKIMGSSPRTKEWREKLRQGSLNVERIKCKHCKDSFTPGMYSRWHDNKCKQREVVNHKVVSVERLNVEKDVYDLIVPNYNNFALSAGVFVHNCGHFTMPYDYVTNTDLSDDFWVIKGMSL